MEVHVGAHVLARQKTTYDTNIYEVFLLLKKYCTVCGVSPAAFHNSLPKTLPSLLVLQQRLHLGHNLMLNKVGNSVNAPVGVGFAYVMLGIFSVVVGKI